MGKHRRHGSKNLGGVRRILYSHDSLMYRVAAAASRRDAYRILIGVFAASDDDGLNMDPNAVYAYLSTQVLQRTRIVQRPVILNY